MFSSLLHYSKVLMTPSIGLLKILQYKNDTNDFFHKDSWHMLRHWTIHVRIIYWIWGLKSQDRGMLIQLQVGMYLLNICILLILSFTHIIRKYFFWFGKGSYISWLILDQVFILHYLYRIFRIRTIAKKILQLNIRQRQ